MNAARRSVLVGLIGASLFAVLGVILKSGPLISLALGLTTSAISVLSIQLLAGIIGTGASDPTAATKLTVLLWFMKLPLIWLCIAALGWIKDSSVGCFFLGLALVYCVLVQAALWRVPSKPNDR